MDTIKNYLDNMFARLPQTQQVYQLKENILANMEEKYYELIQNGRSENEAIGIVISEFGNIDELLEEMNFSYEEQRFERDQQEPRVDRGYLEQEQIDGFLKMKLENGIRIGLGVMLCILGAAMIILFDRLSVSSLSNILGIFKATDSLGVPILLVFVAIAVALFIYSNMKEEAFKYIADGVSISNEQRASLEHTYQSVLHSYNISIIIAVGLFILSPAGLIITDLIPGNLEEYGVVLLLAMVSIGVCLTVVSSGIRDSYEILLGKKD